jgi:hypothetical protein
LGKLRYDGHSPNISIIIILNETIRAKIIFFSSLPWPDRQVLRAATFDVDNGSVACLGFTPMPLDSLTSRECAAFPNGAHDDQVDAMTQALIRWHMLVPEEIVLNYSEPYRISPI